MQSYSIKNLWWVGGLIFPPGGVTFLLLGGIYPNILTCCRQFLAYKNYYA